jgi:hypothetical protein
MFAPRTPRALAAFATVATLAGCATDTADPTDARLRASLGVRATLLAQTATSVELNAGYLRVGGARVELASTTVSVTPGTQQARLPLDLRPCMTDPERLPAAEACLVDLRVRLLRGTTSLDEQTVAVVVRPGETAVAPAVTLLEVQAVRVTGRGVTPVAGSVGSYTARLALGDTVRLTATALDASGQPVAGRLISWASRAQSIASVDAATGVVTGVSTGTTLVEASSGGRQVAQVSVTVGAGTVAGRAGTLAGRFVNAATGAAVAGVVVRVQGGSVATGAGAAVATVTSGADGRWSTSSLPAGVYSATVTVPSTGGVQGTALSAVTIDGDVDVAAVPLAPTQASAGTLTGRVIDATTGLPLTVPVTLSRVPAAYGVVGSLSGVDSLLAQGGAQTLVQPGAAYSVPTGATATLRARAAGFVDALVYVAAAGTAAATQDIVLAPVGATTEVTRVVLTWGATPRDLDSYLDAPTATGARRVIYFGNEGDCAADPFVCLDVDDTSGFGPETITIARPGAGTYRYVVHRFSSDGTIAASGARVAVYVGNRLARTFTPPAGDGEYWNVFDLVNGQIVPVSTYAATGPRAPDAGGPSARRSPKLPPSAEVSR